MSMPENKRERMRELVDLLNQASDAYYNGERELMSDHEWDGLFDELRELEADLGETLEDSPTQRVSEDTIAGQREEHEFAALSLAKTKQVSELVKWSEGRPIWISWKLDGLTLVATYDNGRLSKLVTRGNGHSGTNITYLADAIEHLPKTISYRGHLVVRGEAIISYSDFEKFLMESGSDFANPRNLASGSLSLLDIEAVRQRHIQWLPFTLVYSDDMAVSWGERMDWLQRQGFQPVERELVKHPDMDDVSNVIDRWTERVTSGSNPFPVDGLVICYDDTEYAATGSVTGHHATRAGLAFKWQDEEAHSELEYVEWSCAANSISPVAVFKPVELEGTTVRRASLCNISECERLGIGDAGTRLAVIKANKIIPKVVRVEEKVGEFVIPSECPVCHHASQIRVSELSGTRTLHCTNAECPAKSLKILTRFVSKEGMDIDGISEQTLQRFINLGWVAEFADIFTLRDHIHELISLEGFGDKSARNLMAAIDKARTVQAQKLLYAVCIPMCGVDVCRRLLGAYKLADLVSLASTTDDLDAFTHISGLGHEKSASFITWFRSPKNLAAWERLVSYLNVEQADQKPTGRMCEGLTFVITGDVHHYRNRAELKTYIESQGGKVTGSVSGSTSFLINNDVNSTSDKNRKARQFGIPVISEDEFIARFAKYAPTVSVPEMRDLFG